MSTDPTGSALINIGDLAKPAVVLIEKISDAIGGIAKRWHLTRVASAEAKAEVIKAEARFQISELEERALHRMIKEEGKKQENIEGITTKAIPLLRNDAKSKQIEDDWLVNFFDKGKLISYKEMQQIWAAMLAGEANKPGYFSKRTVDLVDSLDKKDADFFTRFCSFVWFFGDLSSLTFDLNKMTDFDPPMTFQAINHLDSLGLISIQNVGGYAKSKIGKRLVVQYYQKPVVLQLPLESDNSVPVRQSMLTATGSQLAALCGSKPNVAYYEAILDNWISSNYFPFEPWGPVMSEQSGPTPWYTMQEPVLGGQEEKEPVR
jgi:hypothetical protein